MKFSKYIVGPIIVAVLATVMQIIDQLLAANTIVGSLLAGGGSWIAFQAWACYFLGGCNVKGGVKAFIAYVIGIAASIAIMVLGGWFGGFVGGLLRGASGHPHHRHPLHLLRAGGAAQLCPGSICGRRRLLRHNGLYRRGRGRALHRQLSCLRPGGAVLLCIRPGLGLAHRQFRTAYEKSVTAKAEK